MKLCPGCLPFGSGLDHNEGCVTRGHYESLNQFRARILNITVGEVEKIIDDFIKERAEQQL